MTAEPHPADPVGFRRDTAGLAGTQGVPDARQTVLGGLCGY